MNAALRERLLDLMTKHGIGYFDYSGPDGVMVLHAERPGQDHPPIFAPRAGIFLSRHPADPAAAIWPRRVQAGEIVGWLKIGPLLQAVTATETAEISRPRLADGVLAGFDDRLF